MKRLLAAALAMALCPTTALADWEWSKWGMTPDEVAAASKGTVKTVAADSSKSISGWDLDATGAWTQYDFSFTANFFFDAASKGLMAVALDLPDAKKCGDLRKALVAAYGAPANTQETENISVLDWTAAGNAVKLSDVRLIKICRLLVTRAM